MGEQSEGKRAVFCLSGKIFVDSLPAGLCIGGRETTARRADRESDGVRLMGTEEGREKEDEKQEKEEGDNDDRTIRKRGGKWWLPCDASGTAKALSRRSAQGVWNPM